MSHIGAGPAGITEVTVRVAAVFDGHNGAEASEMASKLLLEYFTLHTYFILDTTFSILSKKSIGRLPNKGEDYRTSQTRNWNEELGRHVLNFGRCLPLSLAKTNTHKYTNAYTSCR